jgi:hypothetical protein
MKNKFENPSEPEPESEVELEEEPGLNVPLYERLSKKDQDFVREINELSSMSEDEFNAKAKVKFKRLVTLRSKAKDEERYVTDMMELVKLHLSELQDEKERRRHIESGSIPAATPIELSKRTQHIIRAIINRVQKVGVDTINLPDSIVRERDVWRQWVYSTNPDSQLKAIHTILNVLHRYKDLPALEGWVRDLPRYDLMHHKKEQFYDMHDQHRPQKKSGAGEFFSKLSDLGNELKDPE